MINRRAGFFPFISLNKGSSEPSVGGATGLVDFGAPPSTFVETTFTGAIVLVAAGFAALTSAMRGVAGAAGLVDSDLTGLGAGFIAANC